MEEAIKEVDETAMMVTKRRKEKRKERKKLKRRMERRERAEKDREEEERKMNDPEEQRRAKEMEELERERMEKDRKEFEERERKWMEETAIKRKIKEQEEEEERNKKHLQEVKDNENECSEVEDWDYVEEGPAEIIWQGNEIIVRKKKIRVPKKNSETQGAWKEGTERPTSNPLPPQSEAFFEYKNASMVPAQEMLQNVAQQVPNFGTEQDKAHCPFHLKTGACRFGQRCSRVHFYPDKACTLLIKNMYNGPGLAWEQDEGLEYTDEEVDRCYEEFYEDVHTEFLKYGEIVNFKVCKNSSFHLRGNVYVHYKSLESAVLAYHSINGRYFAGKQVKCEFVNLTRWKVAICGEYMKLRLKTCSHGSACNFIHCFRNPGGDYEWADWDKPPPRYWVKKMAALFGHSDEPMHEKRVRQEKLGQLTPSNKMMMKDTDGHHGRRSRSRDFTRNSGKSSDEEDSIHQQRHIRHGKTANIKGYNCSKGRSHGNDGDGDLSDGDLDCDVEYRHNGHAMKRSKYNREVRECPTDYGTSSEELSDGSRSGQKHDDTKRLGPWAKRGFRYGGDDKNGADGVCTSELVIDVGGEKRHSNLGINSRHGRKMRSQRDVEDTEGRPHGVGSSGECRQRDREGGRQHSLHGNQRRQSSGHHNLSEVSDHWDDDRYRTHGNDSSDDQFDRDKERHHGHRKKCSWHSGPGNDSGDQSDWDQERSHGHRGKHSRHSGPGNDSDDQSDRDKERLHGNRRKRSRHTRPEVSDDGGLNAKR